MLERRRLLTGSVFAMVAACLTAGCEPQLGHSEEALLSYFRNARVNGGVRRAWPEGQEYLNKVLKADAKLQTEFAALREFEAAHSLWHREDPRWRDAEVLGKRVADLAKLVEAPEANREELLQKLEVAVSELPAGLGLTTGGESAFIERVWDALAMPGTELGMDVRNVLPRLEEPARLHLRLARDVQGAAEDFDAAGKGLAFKDAARQAPIDAQYDALERLLRERREAFLKYAEQELATCRARLKDIDKRAEKLDYEYLTNWETYLRDELEAIPKTLAAMIEKAREELEKLENEAKASEGDEKAALDAKIAFTEQHIERLTAEHKELQGCIAPLVRKPGQTGAD